MAKHKQSAFAGFDQGKIGDIESWADEFDEKRALLEGLSGELTNAEFKLAEAMHANEAQVDHQKGSKGEKWLVYKRGDYKIVIKEGKEKVNVKIGQKSKGTAPEGTAEQVPE